MGLVKVSHKGTHVYALPSSDAVVEQSGEQRLSELLQDLPIDVRESGTMLVIRAVPGTAHAIAAAMDRAHWDEVLGTIAGDDTLFVACVDEKALQAHPQSAAPPGPLATPGRPDATPPTATDDTRGRSR